MGCVYKACLLLRLGLRARLLHVLAFSSVLSWASWCNCPKKDQTTTKPVKGDGSIKPGLQQLLHASKVLLNLLAAYGCMS